MSTIPSLTSMSQTLERASVCHDQCLFASWAVRTSRRQTAAPSRRAWLARLICEGKLSWQDSGMVDAFYLGDTTGLQREHCACDLDEAELLWAARSDIVRAGCAPVEVEQLRDCITGQGVPFDGLSATGEESLAATTFFIDAPTRYYDPGWADELKAGVASLGRDIGFTARGSSGFEAFDVGLTETADACANELVGRLSAHGVQRLVVDSPGALFMLRRLDHPGLEVLHISEYFDRHIAPPSGLDPAHGPLVVTLQDSALLARYCQLTVSPRRLLASLPGVELKEMPTSGVLANPSGPRLWPPDESVRQEMAESRVDEAASTGAGTIITLGPYAKRNLSGPAARRGMQVLDLIEFYLHRTSALSLTERQDPTGEGDCPSPTTTPIRT